MFCEGQAGLLDVSTMVVMASILLPFQAFSNSIAYIKLAIYRCLGWKNQNKPTNKRTCKHLREYLGDEFEDCRCGITSASQVHSNKATNRSPRHKQIKQLLLAHKWQEES